jgi:hypothetical protein
MATPPKRARWNALRSRAKQVTPKPQARTPNRPTRLGSKGKRGG